MWNNYTPALTASGNDTLPQYVTVTGRYIRHRTLCFVDIYMALDGGNEGSGNSGPMTVTLPYSSSLDHSTEYFPVGTASNGLGRYIIFGQIAPGASVMTLKYLSAVTIESNFAPGEQNSTSRTVRLKFNYEIIY